ncbi:hypothetical protein ABPG74_011062 [Tetrahymena malaccensis]
MDEKNDKEGKDITDEQAGIIKLLNDMKIMIFEIVISLLKEEPILFIGRSILIGLETIQVISYVFEPQLVGLWKNTGFVNVIQYIMRYTRIVPFLENLTFSAFQIVFFMTIFILVVVIFLLIYMVLTIRKKAQIFGSVNGFVRYFSEFMCSILFIPLLELFLIVFKCSSQTVSSTTTNATNSAVVTTTVSNGGALYNIVWPDTQCYTGNYIAFVLLGSLFSLMILIYTTIITLIYFECRLTTTDCNSKSTARGDLLFLLFKTTLVVQFTFLTSNSYQVIMIFIYSIVSAWYFSHFCFNLFYNHYYVAKLVTAKSAICMWTSLMLILAKLMENYAFDGTPFIWIIGMPFIVLIVIIRQDQNFDYILINSNNYEVLSQPMCQLVYLTKLLNLYHTDKSIAILIDGFLDFHRSLTSKEDSHTKRRVLKTTKFSKMLRERGECEQVIMVIAVIQGMYYYGLQKFPNNTRLRILYALYLLDKMLSKQQALQELLNAEIERPAFDESFIIYRYKQIIENSLMERTGMDGKKGDNFEMVNELSVQNHLKQCRQNVEKSANLHMEFWSQLSEDSPDLGKLSEIGYKINVVNSLASEQWNKLQQTDSNVPSMMRLYAKFMIEILNDKEGGEQILLRLGDMNSRNSNKKGSALIDLSSESKPTIFISAEDDSFGIITNINLAASGQLGYNKMEILNRNVKVLMPQMYSKFHDNFLETYLSTLEPRILNTERLLPGKNKLDYLVPLQALVRHVPSLIHGLQFVAQFKIQKTVNLYTYLLIDTEGKIQNLTSTCISILSVDQKRVLKKKMNIVDAIPDFWDKLKEYQSKNGSHATVCDLRKKTKEFQANVQAQEVSFRLVGHQGYYVKIEKQRQVTNKSNIIETVGGKDVNNNTLANTMRTDRKTLLKHFQVKYDTFNKKYLGELCEGPPVYTNDDFDQSHIIISHDNSIIGISQIDKIEDMRTAEEKLEAEELLKPKYGQGIKTVRLMDGQLKDIEDLKRDDGEDDDNTDDEENGQGLGQKNADEDEAEDTKELGNIFKKRSNFLQFTSSNQFLYSNSMKQLRLISYLFIIVLCSMCLLNHFLTSNSFDECNTRYNLLNQNNLMTAEGQRILMKVSQMCSLNQKLIQVNDPTSYFTSLLTDLSASYDTMSTIQTQLSQVTLDLTAQHQNMLNNNVIAIKSKNSDGQIQTDMYNFNDVTRQLLSVVNTLQSSPISKFNFLDQDIYKVQYNFLNDYYIAQSQISNYFVTELDNWANNKSNLFLVLLILSIMLILVLLLIILPFYFWVTKSQKEVLTIFLEIPTPKVKKLFQKCENFVNQMQSGNDEEMFSDTSLQSNHGEEDAMFLRSKGKKRRKFKIDLKNRNNFFIPFILCVLFFEAYFIATYFVSTQLANSVQQFVQEMNTTTMSERYYSYALNVQVQLLIDPSFTANLATSHEYLQQAINGMYNLNSDVQREHSNNINALDPSYVKQYQNIMFTNQTCQILTDARIASTQQCEGFAEGTIMQGLSLSLPRYIENFRYITSQYEDILKNTTDQNQIINYLNQQINATHIQEMYEMQDLYVRGLFESLVNVFLSSLQTTLNTSQGTRVTLLIIGLIVQVLLYLFFWLPVLAALGREVVRIRSMITMIPLEICQQTRLIRELIQNYANINSNIQD